MGNYIGFGYITVTKTIKGKPLTKKQIDKFEEAYQSLTPITFEGKKVIITKMMVDLMSNGKLDVDLEMEEIK